MDTDNSTVRSDDDMDQGEQSECDQVHEERQNRVESDEDAEQDSYVVSIVMTREQQEVVQAVFMHNEWEYIEVGEREKHYNMEGDSEIEMPGRIIPHKEDADECPYCFCRPCITDQSNRQFWWEDESQDAHDRNSGIRKGLYKKFCTMLFHRMAWHDPRYMAKKAAALAQDANRRYNVWAGGRTNKRDIMPDCVLKLMRGWYPNPPHLQYMGHRWG